MLDFEPTTGTPSPKVMDEVITFKSDDNMMYLVRNTFYEFTPIWLRNIQLAIAETSAWEWYCREAGYYIRKRRQNHGNFSDKIMAIFWQNHYNIFDKILEIYFDKIMATSLTKSWQYLWQDQCNLTKPWQQNWQNCGKILKKKLFQQFVAFSIFLCWWRSWIIKYQTFQGFWPPTKIEKMISLYHFSY